MDDATPLPMLTAALGSCATDDVCDSAQATSRLADSLAQMHARLEDEPSDAERLGERILVRAGVDVAQGKVTWILRFTGAHSGATLLAYRLELYGDDVRPSDITPLARLLQYLVNGRLATETERAESGLPERPWGCAYCDAAFRSYTAAAVHERHAHPEMIPATEHADA